MKLAELNPRWLGAGGEGVFKADGTPAPERRGVGITFDCPCGCSDRVAIEFTVALDGQPWRAEGWARTGDTFEALTLQPSLQRVGGCAWHGWVTAGEVITC